MSELGLEFGNYDLPVRNRLAGQIIASYATKHAAADAGLGLLGFVPIPGAATASILGALALQIPVYKLLAFDLARVYSAPVRDGAVEGIVNAGIALGSALNVGDAIVDQFGMDFIKEIASALLTELGIGIGVSFVPFFGGFVSLGMDVAIAITMTWRVGTMVSIYFQNGQDWIGSRKTTHGRSKELTGGLSIQNEGRVNLDRIPSANPEIAARLAEQLSHFVEPFIREVPSITDKRLHEIIRSQNKDIPHEVAEKAIAIARGRIS